ncbi:MAG: GtrA family protein [Sphingomicrobium sp.]
MIARKLTDDPERQAMIGQLLRFVITGGFVTALGVGVYALVALWLHWDPQLGNFLAYVVAVATGYVLHSRWSFRDHGGQRTHSTKLRFAAVSIISYALNSLWVWLLFTHFDLGRAAPIVPMLFVTPVVTFILNRQWVFR